MAALVSTDHTQNYSPFDAETLSAHFEASEVGRTGSWSPQPSNVGTWEERFIPRVPERPWNFKYQDHLPGRTTYLRESLLPQWGYWGRVDWAGNIIWQVQGPHISLVQAPYLQMNRKGFIDQIEIDIDSNFDLALLEQSGLPQPRYLACRRRRQGDPDTYCRRPHAVWWLRVPVRKADPDNPREGDERRKSTEHWAEAIRQTLIRRLRDLGLKVDPKRPGLGKNPHHEHWHCVSVDHRDWSLAELTNALGGRGQLLKKCQWTSREIEFEERVRRILGKQPLTRSTADPGVLVAVVVERTEARDATRRYLAGQGRDNRYFDAVNASQGRNCFVFEAIRGAVYMAKNSHGSSEALVDFAHEEARRVNECLSRPLGPRELFGIAKSVANWTWEHFATGESSQDEATASCNRGVCWRLGLISSKTEGRVIAGRYAAAKRAQQGYEMVKAAKERWLAAGRSLNASAIARELGVNRKTVSKYLRLDTAPAMPEPANLNQAPTLDEFVGEKLSKTVPIRKEGGIGRPKRQIQGWYDPSIPDDFEVIDRFDAVEIRKPAMTTLDTGHLKLRADNENRSSHLVGPKSSPNGIVLQLWQHRRLAPRLPDLKKTA